MTRVEATELNREDTIRQVTDWCRVQEGVVLSEPGREINLALYRRDWDHSTTFCLGYVYQVPMLKKL